MRADLWFSIWFVVFVLIDFLQPVMAAEVVHFNSAVPLVSSAELKRARKQDLNLQADGGTPLWGHLSKPDGTGPFPAVVLMHGCGGIHASIVRWADELKVLGYVTLLLDSFRPRSVFSICSNPVRKASPAMRALDAHGALHFLQNLEFVDKGRIGLIGWSQGGISALLAVNKYGIADRLSGRFNAVIAFYPYCISDRDYELPALILMGEADDWVPLRPCRALALRNAQSGNPFKLITYPGAHHAFDSPELQKGWSIKGADGNAHFLMYNKKAHVDSVQQVDAFLSKHVAGH